MLENFTFKTIPKSFTDEVGVERTVVGIQAKMTISIDIDLLENNFSRQFFIAFLLESGTIYGQRNAYTSEFIRRSVENGIDETIARESVKTICKLLEYGTLEERYVASFQLAQIYGYELLPLNEQLNIIEEPQEEL